MAIKTIGIDLGKTIFVAAALDGGGKLVGPAKRHSRKRLVAWLANRPPCLIGMEAGSGAHHLARTLQAQGHTVRLLPGQAVKPFRGAIKNDAADALAIAEAVRRPGLCPVPIKSEAQLDLQAIHRVRSQLLRERTALINQVRGLRRERGLAVPQGPHRLAQALAELRDAPAGISATLDALLARRRAAWRQLDAELAELDRLLLAHARTDIRCHRLMSIPGLGPVTATALVAAVAMGSRSGRQSRTRAARPSGGRATSPPGSTWYPGNIPPAAAPASAASARAATAICAPSWSTARVPCAARARPAAAGWAPGWPRSRAAPTATRSPSRWPTSAPGSPGRSSPASRATAPEPPEPTSSASVAAMARTG